MKKLTQLLSLLLFCVFAAFSQETVDIKMLEQSISEAIHLSTRADVKDQKRIVLEWKCKPLKSEQFFTIERSKNTKDFEVIGVIKARTGQSVFEFTDELPATANNFYRIRSVFSGNQEVFSKILSRGVAVVQFSKFYPNPVEKFLIVRTESTIELKITDQLNKVRISKQLAVGLQLVDVTALEKGLYIITLYQKESNRIISDKLIKN